MANREVNLTKRVQTGKGMRYCPVVLSANGRVKPDVVLVNGQEERHTEGAITWNGPTAPNVAGCPWARMLPMPARAGWPRRPN
jgi:hypothetical protein